MNEIIRKKWLDAAKILRENPGLQVVCPHCNHEYLEVKDVVGEKNGMCDRYIRCANCGVYNVISFKLFPD